MSSKNSPDKTSTARPVEPAFQAVLGRVPSGLFILTVATEPQPTGMLASWVMQAGFDPPMLTVALKQGRYVTDWLAAGNRFVLNLIGEQGKQLLQHFGRGFEPGEPAFHGRELLPESISAPALREAIGYLECEPVGHLDSADHRIVLARVVGGRLLESEQRPWIHVRSSGGRY